MGDAVAGCLTREGRVGDAGRWLRRVRKQIQQKSQGSCSAKEERDWASEWSFGRRKSNGYGEDMHGECMVTVQGGPGLGLARHRGGGIGERMNLIWKEKESNLTDGRLKGGERRRRRADIRFT